MNTTIYIDDTGTSGLKSKSAYDSEKSVSWFAIVLTSEERLFAEVQMKDCLYELKQIYNASEFHFKDIYNGRKEFEGIDLDARLKIFHLFADVYRRMEYPLLMQTFSPEEYSRNSLTNNAGKQKIDGFDLNNSKDFALYHLLLRIKGYLNSNGYSYPVEIIIDEGRQKKNSVQPCNLFTNNQLKIGLQYKSSKEEPLLQLIDFAAYCLNRVKWIMQNNSKKSIDKTFMEICSYANFNTINMKKGYVDVNVDMQSKYDDILKDAYSKNSIFPEIDLEQYKDELSK